MRISQRMIFNNFMRDVNKNRSEMAEIQDKLSSGLRVREASDNPVNFEKSRIIGSNIRKAEQFQSNLTSGMRQGRLAQEALDSVVDQLIEIKEVATQGASSSLSAEQRDALADQVAGIRQTIIDDLNESYGERHLFAGTDSATPPFDAAGNYTGNATTPTVLASDGVELDISVNGADLAATPAGDMFTVLDNLETELRNNNGGAVNNLMTDMDEVVTHVTDMASQLGDNINRMEFMHEQYESLKITQESDVSELVDTNYAQSFSDLQRNQVAYESAMAAHSKMFQNTLLQYI